jgi:hypothetical protein
MTKENGHDIREGGGAFMSNTTTISPCLVGIGSFVNTNGHFIHAGPFLGPEFLSIYLSLTLITILKFSVEHDRVVTTLNIIFSVVELYCVIGYFFT